MTALTENRVYFPLSLSQEGMWLALQMASTSAAYNVPYLANLVGPLRKNSLKCALARVIERHESLRTTFVLAQDRILQDIVEQIPLPYEERDFRAAPDPVSAALSFARDEARRPFDLSTGPLVRIWLLQAGDEHYYLLCVLHHLICDGWSMEVLLREISEFYAADWAGRAPQPPSLPLQYADFAVWQRQQFQGEALASRVHYWQQILSGAPPLLTFPGTRPRPPVPTFEGAEYQLVLPRSLAEQLTALGQAEQCTLFMVLQAAFQLLLSSVTGQRDLVIGTAMANRMRSEVQHMIGLFTNMVVLRSQLAPDCSLRQFLQLVRSATLDVYAHQDFPFEELVKIVKPVRVAGASPCFQVTFSLQQQDQETLQLPDIAVESLIISNGTSKFDLTLNVQLTTKTFIATFIYDAALFDASSVQKLADEYQRVLERFPLHLEESLSAWLPQTPQPVQEAPGEIAQAPEAAFVAPQSTLEQLIAEIWQTVLDTSEISVHDNFFDLGGYSLLMIQVQRQLRDILGIQVELTDLFRYPTISTLASFLHHGFDDLPALLERRERGRTRDQALGQQRARREEQRARRGGTHG